MFEAEGLIAALVGYLHPLQVGKPLIFDDSFEHEVWNNDATARYVLHADMWHPGLFDFIDSPVDNSGSGATQTSTTKVPPVPPTQHDQRQQTHYQPPDSSRDTAPAASRVVDADDAQVERIDRLEQQAVSTSKELAELRMDIQLIRMELKKKETGP